MESSNLTVSMECMILLGKADLLDRWIYTRQGVHKTLSWLGFPDPYVLADRGRLIGWQLSDIEDFEHQHPELVDTEAKADKCRDRSKKTSRSKSWRQVGPESYLGPRDLRDRWFVERYSFDQAVRSVQFPDPTYTFNHGRARVWSMSCVRDLEADYGPDPIFSGAFDTFTSDGCWAYDQLNRTKELPIIPEYKYPEADEGRQWAEQSIPYQSDLR